VELSTGGDMLPSAEKADKVRSSHGLDLSAETTQRQTMDLCQDMPIAPLNFRTHDPRRGRETAAQHLAFTFEPQ
jgi:hypothetical protein